MMTEAVERWPGQTEDANPEVFNTVPPNSAPTKPGQLSTEQVKQFFTKGYVVVDEFFVPEELQPVRDDIEELVAKLAQKLYDGGKIKKLYKEYGLFERLSYIEKEFPGANVILHKQASLTQGMRDLWSNTLFLNVAEQLLGSADIVGHPVWNLRTKTPKNEAVTVPWHQDVGYLDNSSYNTLQVTAWVPLLDANEENGCMQLMERGQKTGKVATHQCCHGGTWYVSLEEEEMQKKLEIDTGNDRVTLPVPYGGVLFFSNMIPHRSLNNMSNKIRWSLDLRWQKLDRPIGFYGLKEGIQMRSATDANFKIDWSSFESVDRHKKFAELLNKEEDEFDTTISGPWMKKWEIVHMNKHTDAFEKKDGDLTWHP